MDSLDQKILAALSADARTSITRLARRLGVARSTVQARIRRLEKTGTIAGYTIRLGAGARARRIRATVLVQIEPRASAGVLHRLRALPQVEAAHSCSGRFDLVLRLACETTRQLDEVLDRIGAIPGVRASESLIHLSTRFDRTL